MAKKLQVHKFNNDIYQPCIYVVVDNRIALIEQSFTDMLRGDESLDLSDIDNATAAFVYSNPVLFNDNDDNGGWLIVFRSRQSMTSGIIAHEAFHAMSFYSDNIGLSDDGARESRAYLLEWIFKCIENVKTNKGI